MVVPSVCAELSESEIERLDQEESNEIDHSLRRFLFNDVKIDVDGTYGQRGFTRNLERHCTALIQFYSDAWPKQYKATQQKLAD